MDEVSDKFKPPYMSFQTFWGFIEELGANPLPPQIDRSLMDTRSGTDQANLTSALKGFGLIRDDLSVTPVLDQLVGAEADERKALLANIVHTYYSDALSVSAKNGTEKQLNDCFRDVYDLDAAETRRKAVTFFLHAARTAGISLSPHFPATRTGTGAGGGGGGRPRRSTPRRNKPEGGGGSGQSFPPKPRAGAKLIDFGESGTVEILAAIDWLTLPAEKMVALRGLIDQLDALASPDWKPTEKREAPTP